MWDEKFFDELIDKMEARTKTTREAEAAAAMAAVEERNNAAKQQSFCRAYNTLDGIQWTGKNIEAIVDFLVWIGDSNDVEITMDIGTRELEIIYYHKNPNLEVSPGEYLILENGELTLMSEEDVEKLLIAIN